MVVYQCPRCGYEFAKIANYKDHIKRKNICEPLLGNIELTENNFIRVDKKFSCENCDKNYSTKDKLKNHKCKPITNNIILNGNNSNITSNSNNNNINIHIHVNDFKHTNTEYVSQDNIYGCLNKCVSAVPILLKGLHFNPNHPENHNIYMSNLKDKIIRYKEGNKWIIKNGKEFIEDIIVDYHNKFFHPFSENEEVVVKYKNVINVYNQYLDRTESKEAKKIIIDNIIELMYNNRDIVKKTNNL